MKDIIVKEEPKLPALSKNVLPALAELTQSFGISRANKVKGVGDT